MAAGLSVGGTAPLCLLGGLPPHGFCQPLRPLGATDPGQLPERLEGGPLCRYFYNTFVLVCITLIGQFILCTMAAYAFARYEFPGKDIAFLLVLVQIMIMRMS
jgi:sn-glycerol 3-phosphate transport system permease protein